MPLSERLGALRERDFRLLFAGTMITTLGDRLASIALAFAVLDIASATALGIVFAVRQVVEALVLVGGGVLSDRLPRNLVIGGASLVQGAAQAATAALVLTGSGSILAIVVLQGIYGVGAGLVVPAEVGLVPQTVSPARLQQANALQGLSRNFVRILGPAIGGAIVVAGSPGTALAIDAVSFLVCAVLLARIRVPSAQPARDPRRRSRGGHDRPRRRALGRRGRDRGREPLDAADPLDLADRRRGRDGAARPRAGLTRLPRMSVIVRMAPSPTGFLHIGGVHTF